MTLAVSTSRRWQTNQQSLVLTALSLLSPVFAAGAVASTKVTLAAAHVLAAAIAIPIIARRLAVTSDR